MTISRLIVFLFLISPLLFAQASSPREVIAQKRSPSWPNFGVHLTLQSELALAPKKFMFIYVVEFFFSPI